MKANLLSLVTIAALSFSLISCAVSKSSDGRGMNPTIYFKPTIHQDKSNCSANDLRDLLSPKGRTLATLCSKDYDQCLLQGSCFVDDGTKISSYNYHSTKEGVPRFIDVELKECPYGYGVNGSCLDPYFSVAADLSIYQVGDVLFIPRLVGAALPNGEIHDGYVIVRDTGGAIVGANRFDFFTGFYDHRAKENTLARLGFSDPRNHFEFRLATAEEAQAVRVRRNYPRLKQDVLEEGIARSL
ncbi:3D domain-containing protein [Bdellovibrio sp. 22V]|uniref:3D domain-containing protein n=1 Tax=Bdellovibrio TaxID=958 RepID=UPI002542A337|nr:3D domain-containing protein [Bdellovibrio sp. 22V]WII70727.1 3D domain-containing protein [Bdellovibrio sp. 22V]